MKKRVSTVTWHYMLITAGFWMSFCLVSTNAAIYLQAIGYSNAQLGLIMALGNVGGALLSTALGDFLDRHPQVRHVQVLNLLTLVQAVMIVLLWFHQTGDLLSGAIYTVYCSALMAVNAVNLDLCIRFEHAGADLNFGLARSSGSLAFMVLSVLLGILVERFDHKVLLMAGLLVLLFQFLSNLIVDRDLKAAEAAAPAYISQARAPSASLPAFVKKNGMFSVLLLGVILIFTAHNIDGNFMINEIRALGGGTADMGWIAAFQALVEVPVMVFSAKLPRSRGLAWYIRVAFIFFVIKLLAYALAPSLPFFFAARLLQAPSYALYIVLVVSYADQVIPLQDSAKAQGLLVSATNLGAVFASLVGGALFDSVGVRPTMLTAVAIALLGAVIGFLGTRKSAECTRP